MPKTKLNKFLGVKGSGWKKMWPIDCRLQWEGKFLQYKWIIWKRIDLSKIQAWNVGPEWKTKSIKLVKQTRVRSIFLTVSGKGEETTKWEFAVPEKHFFTWIYWLIVSIQKHGKMPVSEERLKGLGMKDSRKGKIRALHGINQFDPEHPIFVNATALYESGEELSPRRENRMITGDSETQYKVQKKIKSGGGGAIYSLERMKWKMIGPHKPVVAKVAPMVGDLYGLKGNKKAVAEDGKALIREGRILSAIGEHPNIIRIVDAVASDRCVYVFLEKGEYDLGDLSGKGKLAPGKILDLSIGFLSGLEHMHRRRIYHLDMKPDNVLIFDDGTPKVIDFGITVCRAIDSKEIAKNKGGKDKNGKVAGTVGYLPPESWNNFPTIGKEISKRFEMRDSYAAGMTILDALIGPVYGLKYKEKLVPQHRTLEKKKLEYWIKKIDKKLKTETNKTMKYICTLAKHMIKEEPALRLSVQQSLAGLKRIKEDMPVVTISPRKKTSKRFDHTKRRDMKAPKPRIKSTDELLATAKGQGTSRRPSRPGKKSPTKHDAVTRSSAFKFFEELERKNK